MSKLCGCCQGTEILTPQTTANRPGLPRLSYRAGTHAAFLETMKARLSSSEFPELAGLKTRATSDPAVALLDSWALVADVLTFYQERIANEGYLGTATERRSVLELARLLGYKLRPGVAATVYLAYTLDEDRSATPPKPMAVSIAPGARVQSVPGPGELPQSFETSDPLDARSEWNNLQVRLTRPQVITLKMAKATDAAAMDSIYLAGISTSLKANDSLLLVFGDDKGKAQKGEIRQVQKFVESVELDQATKRTKVVLQGRPILDPPLRQADFNALVASLQIKPFVPPSSAARLGRTAAGAFAGGSDLGPRMLLSLNPTLKPSLYKAWANATVTDPSELKSCEAFRVKAALFGHNATVQPKPAHREDDGLFTLTDEPTLKNTWGRFLEEDAKGLFTIVLDANYEQIKPGSWIAIQRPTLKADKSPVPTFHKVENIRAVSASTLGVSLRVTLLTLRSAWLDDKNLGEALVSHDLLPQTTVFAQSEPLDLAEEPIPDPVGRCALGTPEGATQIELQGLYDGLESGRWLIVSGEQTIAGTSGVRVSELVMLTGVEQHVDPKLPGDTTHTVLTLADNGLAYCYQRDTVVIYGNVVKATHGETRNETLGSGDGSKSMQSFPLRQPPLTFVSASNPSGAESTLQLRVNDVQWHETDSLAGLLPRDRKFVTRIGDDASTTVVFGTGEHGARLPTGQENVKAVYRSGIGKPGNVNEEQISLLATRPLGVKGVINPLRASGGAEKEDRDQTRRNAPLAVMALDRLVSVQDYADFARTFAGIGKASAARLSDGSKQVVHVTIAGADDIPIDESSDLFRNLLRALHDFGDPYQSIQLAVRELMALVISAKVRTDPDYQWEKVVLKVRQALLDKFSLANRELGQDAVLSEAISTMQKVEGVVYVDVDVFGGILSVDPESGHLRSPDQITEIVQKMTTDPPSPCPRVQVDLAQPGPLGIQPAQLAFLTPDVTDTVILTEVTS